MELNDDLEALFEQARDMVLEALEQEGQFSAFALTLPEGDNLWLFKDPDPSGDNRHSVQRLLAVLLPLAKKGEIKASVICTCAPGKDFGMDRDAAVFYLEHEALIGAVATVPYQKRDDVGWVFDDRLVGPQDPILFAFRQRTEPLKITHPEFELQLGEGWQQFPGDDPEQFSFHSASRKVSVVLSVAVHPVVGEDRLLKMAEVLAEGRVQGEREARSGGLVKVTFCNAELIEDGRLGRVIYAGYDERSIFRFMGWVSQRKVVNLWVSTEGHDNERSKAMFDEVYRGLRLHLP